MAITAITAITVPKWGIEMQEATLAEWKVEVGAAIAKGDEIVDLETDKIVNAHEAPADGVLARIIGEVDERYDVGTLIGVIAPADTPAADIDAFIDAFVPVDASFDGDEGATDEPAPPPATPAPVAASGSTSISPIAKRLAESLGVDWTTIKGTGRNGRISKQDVEAAAAAAGDQPIKQTAMARTAATRMQAAKQEIPHFYLQIDIVCDAVQAQRATYNQTHGCRVTLNDVLLKAVATTLQQQPAINVCYRDDALYPASDAIGVAIAATDGLIAPVIENASGLSLQAISESVKRLADQANDRALTAAQLTGGATTVSNLGMFGVDRFTAIINPPQTSIIAVGKARQQAVAKNGELTVATLMKVTMSCDHRAFDGATGAKFLGALKATLEAPDALFD
ncbi:MAG: dihydrolipoamide acetyltransferase family protein [Pseudomonadota bacterium]